MPFFLPMLAMTAAAGAGYGASKLLGKGDDGRFEGYNLPEYYEDPDYRKSQDFLSEYGQNIMEGDIPDYYSPIGESGGAEFENYLGLMRGDIQKSALESSAALGRGGGRATDIAAERVGELSTKARFADYERMLQGRQYLFGQGRGITEGVRGAGQAEGANRNTFALNRAEKEVDLLRYLTGRDDEFDAKKSELIMKAGEMAIGAGMGYATGGMSGAVAGGMGGFDYSSIFSGGGTPGGTKGYSVEEVLSAMSRGKALKSV